MILFIYSVYFMRITQKITYSDRDIENLIQEPKELPDNWKSLLYKATELDVDGADGNKFRIIVRQNDSFPLDFSVILAVLVPLSDRVFRLRRYNGWTNPHINRIERNEVDGFHIHFATERYQRRRQKEDGYAKKTCRYNDFDGAVQCLIEDANFKELPQSQLHLFKEV